MFCNRVMLCLGMDGDYLQGWHDALIFRCEFRIVVIGLRDAYNGLLQGSLLQYLVLFLWYYIVYIARLVSSMMLHMVLMYFMFYTRYESYFQIGSVYVM